MTSAEAEDAQVAAISIRAAVTAFLVRVDMFSKIPLKIVQWIPNALVLVNARFVAASCHGLKNEYGTASRI